VILRCTSNVNGSYIRWYNSTCAINKVHSNCLADVIYGGRFVTHTFSHFNVTEVTNATHVTRDLNVNLTQLTDAGVYLCVEQVPGDDSILDSSSAQLIVLGNYIAYLGIK